MNSRVAPLILFLLLVARANALSFPATCAPSHRNLAAGVTYEQFCRSASPGEPWSIHLLRVNRKSGAQIHLVEGQNEHGEMKRELPTALAKQEQQHGHKVVAVVNGDFDFVKPESLMGVPEGVAVVDGRVWTTERTNRPVMAFTNGGEPLIGDPAVAIDFVIAGRHYAIAALNKPLDAADSSRLFTDEFRSSVALDHPTATIVVNKLSEPTPLPMNKTIRGTIGQISPHANALNIPANSLVITAIDPARFKPGDSVTLRIDVKVNGKRARYASGGMPILVRNGTKHVEGDVGENLKKRHPRTAICYNREEMMFVVVDGRQPKLSIGMTLDELAELMIGFGCKDAMNTDGGGSSVMAVVDSASELHIVNSPSDGHERGRGNAWVIESK